MTVMWVVSLAGALLGLAHAGYVFCVVSNTGAAGAPPDRWDAAYFALWTLGLWLLLGGYVLVLWLAGAVLYLAFKVLKR